MAYKSKAVWEKEFVQFLLSVGIKSYGAMDEGRNTYYIIYLKNETTRYWTNFSDESLKMLFEVTP